MVSKTVPCGVVLAFGVLGFLNPSASADDKKSDKPALSGTWAKKDSEVKIEFADKDVLKIIPHGDSAVVVIVCAYTVEKDGLVKVKVTGFEGKEEVKQKVADKVPVGFKFRFKWTVKGAAAKLDDLSGDNVDLLKGHLEGDFAEKK